jgi:hypothetical protein
VRTCRPGGGACGAVRWVRFLWSLTVGIVICANPRTADPSTALRSGRDDGSGFWKSGADYSIVGDGLITLAGLNFYIDVDQR